MRVSAGAWLPVLRRLPGATEDVALSYDDSPNPDSTLRLLEVLDAHHAKATFFLSGFRAVDHPEIVREIVRRGHQTYAHGWDHVRLDRVPLPRLIEEMEKTEALLRRWRPTPPQYLVRLPHHGGYRSSHIHRAIRRWNSGAQYAHTSIVWPDHKVVERCRTATDVDTQCRAAIHDLFASESIPGAILILHDKPVGIDSHYSAEVTVRLTELFLAKLDERGLRAVPIAPASARQSLISRFLLT